MRAWRNYSVGYNVKYTWHDIATDTVTNVPKFSMLMTNCKNQKLVSKTIPYIFCCFKVITNWKIKLSAWFKSSITYKLEREHKSLINFARKSYWCQNFEDLWKIFIVQIWKGWTIFYLCPFPSLPFSVVDDKNWIQCTNKVLVKETWALAFISFDLK